jgi:hypothetical protein
VDCAEVLQCCIAPMPVMNDSQTRALVPTFGSCGLIAHGFNGRFVKVITVIVIETLVHPMLLSDAAKAAAYG